MSQELQPTLEQEIAAMKQRLADSPDGEFYFPGARFADRTPEVARLHTFLSRLSFYFPYFIWSTSDSLDPSVSGIIVRWRRRAETVQNPYSKKELDK